MSLWLSPRWLRAVAVLLLFAVKIGVVFVVLIVPGMKLGVAALIGAVVPRYVTLFFVEVCLLQKAGVAACRRRGW